MSYFSLIGFTAVSILFTAALVSANPSMLPKHEGYPMGKATDPVTGQPLSNDPGQTNASGEKALRQSALADDQHSQQRLDNASDLRVLEKPGAGMLPKVQGPQIKIEPPVKEATRAQANPTE
ncbi:MAG TPA: hypothetical protein VFS39_13270 [Nitrospira sp.]|nr:hypothetical protein [Nitrospira sp.]